MVKPKVVCLRSKHDFDRAKIKIPESFDIQFFPQYDEKEVAQASMDTDFILAPSTNPPITAKIISSAKSLKLIQLCGSGYDTVDLEAADKAGVPVAHSPGQNSKTVAEYAFTLMSILNRGILESDIETKRGNYQEVREKIEKEGTYELEGMNLGILGIGPIGKEIAKIGFFFRANLFYYDVIRLSPEQEKEFKLTYLDFKELLKISDILTLHIPLNPNTKKLIGRKELALMKPTAILINTSRGGILDDEALIDALKSNRLKGAALDAFKPEPLPQDHPFLSLGPELHKRLILTSHLGGATRQASSRMYQEAINNILRMVRGESPKYVVNLIRTQKNEMK
jgi:lactate dehydrogenase-like 2-hydroxyacid dehydrogenase